MKLYVVDKRYLSVKLHISCCKIICSQLQVCVICELFPIISIRKTLVTPVVAVVDAAFEPHPNDEVSKVFRLPLDRFLSSKGHSSFVFNKGGFMLHCFEDFIEGVI